MGDSHNFTPEKARAWQRIARDIGNTLVGWAMLIWQTVFAAEPNYLIVGAGVVLVGLAPALRADQWLRGRDETES